MEVAPSVVALGLGAMVLCAITGWVYIGSSARHTVQTADGAFWVTKWTLVGIIVLGLTGLIILRTV